MKRLPAVALAYLWSTLLVSCGGVPPIQDPAGYAQCLLRCKAPGFCAHGAEGWACITPQPTPSPSPTPFPPEDCRYKESGPKCPFGMECRPTENVGAPWECQWPVPVPTPTPTATPTPVPTAVPTPVPTPTPCVPAIVEQKPGRGPGTDNCDTCKSRREYMLRDYWTPANKVGNRYVNYPPGHEGDPAFAIYSNPVTCDEEREDGTVTHAFLSGYFGPVCQRVVTPCPSPSPTPGPTPSPSTPPNPGGGLKCAPLDSIGVAFHAQHPAPNGPLGYRWVFSATPKSVKPFCPEKRNECEQMAYQGDPVGNYDAVVWRFDERFKCQDPAGPLWNQQEPHTGQSWEPTDVRQENNYLANLKPAVKGKHVVRTCRRDSPSVCRYAEKVAN